MRRGSRHFTTCAAPVLSRMRAEPSVRIDCSVASTWDPPPPLRTLHQAIQRTSTVGTLRTDPRFVFGSQPSFFVGTDLQ